MCRRRLVNQEWKAYEEYYQETRRAPRSRRRPLWCCRLTGRAVTALRAEVQRANAMAITDPEAPSSSSNSPLPPAHDHHTESDEQPEAPENPNPEPSENLSDRTVVYNPPPSEPTPTPRGQGTGSNDRWEDMIHDLLERSDDPLQPPPANSSMSVDNATTDGHPLLPQPVDTPATLPSRGHAPDLAIPRRKGPGRSPVLEMPGIARRHLSVRRSGHLPAVLPLCHLRPGPAAVLAPGPAPVDCLSHWLRTPANRRGFLCLASGCGRSVERVIVRADAALPVNTVD